MHDIKVFMIKAEYTPYPYISRTSPSQLKLRAFICCLFLKYKYPGSIVLFIKDNLIKVIFY